MCAASSSSIGCTTRASSPELGEARAQLHRAPGVGARDHRRAGRPHRLGLLALQPPGRSPARSRCRGRRRRSTGRRSRSRRPASPGSRRAAPAAASWMPWARSAWQASWYATRSMPIASERHVAQAFVEAGTPSRRAPAAPRPRRARRTSACARRSPPRSRSRGRRRRTPARSDERAVGRSRAVPLCACSAPQHRCAARHDDAPAAPREHPDRREVHVVEPAVLHASREQRDRAAHRRRRPADPSSRGSRRNGAERRGTIARTRRGMNGRASGCSAAASLISPGRGSTTSSPSQRSEPRARRRGAVPPRCARAPSCGRTARATGRRPRRPGRRGRGP